MIKKLFAVYLLVFIQLGYSQTKVLYGVTHAGGSSNGGVIFQYNYQTNLYTKKYDFTTLSNGTYPQGCLAVASNKKLYGMTSKGGLSTRGVLYEYDIPTGTYTKKIDFNNAGNGSQPTGSLMKASNNKLYGLTSGGGSAFKGVLFEYVPETNTSIKKYEFNDSSAGYAPSGTLYEATNGKLYGMTAMGGSSNGGVLFEYDTSTNIYSKKADFTRLVNGYAPIDNLIQANNGKLYGMTPSGGSSDKGVLFEYNIMTGILTKLVDFSTNVNGSTPSGGLIEASNGKLYGTTTYGGSNENYGTIFEFNTETNTLTTVKNFESYTDGVQPSGTLTQASNGKLYGMANSGGLYSYGTLFEYDPTTHLYAKKFDFNENLGTYPDYSQLIEIDLDDYLSTTNYENKIISIYPNPAKNTIFVNSKQDIINYEIYSFDGKLIRSSENRKKPSQIDISELPKGNYAIVFTLKTNQTVNHKFIKE